MTDQEKLVQDLLLDNNRLNKMYNHEKQAHLKTYQDLNATIEHLNKRILALRFVGTSMEDQPTRMARPQEKPDGKLADVLNFSDHSSFKEERDL